MSGLYVKYNHSTYEVKYVNSNFNRKIKVFKLDDKAESLRIKNYSYEAIEEFLSNAIYHKSYQIHEPITIRIETDKIEITSIPGPDRSITDKDIENFQMRSRRYRNRRIGDFLKDLHLVEGRNTGIPTAIKAIKENGSPLPTLLTDKDISFFSVIIPIHSAFLASSHAKNLNNDSNQSVNKTVKRSQEQIKKLILEELSVISMSSGELYKKLGYSGNPSKTFKKCVSDLISESKIHYSSDNLQDSNNKLIKK